MAKLDFLKNILGEELFTKFIGEVGQKEGAAALLGMVTKEATDAETEPAATPEPDKTVETPGVDVKALADALETKLQPVLAELESFKAASAKLEELSAALADNKTAADALATRLAAVEKSVTETTNGLAELTGEKTRAKSRRATESDTNVTDKEAAGPTADPKNEFMSFLFSGQK